MQHRDSLTLSLFFCPNTKWLQSLTDSLLNDLLFSIDSDSLNMKKKKVHGSVLASFLTHIHFTEFKKGLDLPKWGKWAVTIKSYNHNIWCTSDIKKSVPEGSHFPITPADFFRGAQDLHLFCLFSCLK